MDTLQVPDVPDLKQSPPRSGSPQCSSLGSRGTRKPQSDTLDSSQCVAGGAFPDRLEGPLGPVALNQAGPMGQQQMERLLVKFLLRHELHHSHSQRLTGSKIQSWAQQNRARAWFCPRKGKGGGPSVTGWERVLQQSRAGAVGAGHNVPQLSNTVQTPAAELTSRDWANNDRTLTGTKCRLMVFLHPRHCPSSLISRRVSAGEGTIMSQQLEKGHGYMAAFVLAHVKQQLQQRGPAKL